MAPVAREIMGDPTRKLNGGAELRWGRNGHLSVIVERGVWTNFETAESGGVLDFLRVTRGLEGEAALNFLRQRGLLPRLYTSRTSRIVATYDYEDANGALIFETVYYKSNGFGQRRPDPSTKCGYAWNLRGVTRVPYRLPELLAASPDRVIYVVAGERNVEALRRLGQIATCDPGGPTRPTQKPKWREEFRDYFDRRHVVVVRAHDDGGAHANPIVRNLQGRAASIRLLTLPGLRHEGGVSDWLGEGGNLEQIQQLLQDSPPVSLVLVDPRDLACVPFPTREWIVEDWLPFEHVTISNGAVGVGKALLAQQLMTACATGGYWCGLTVRRCRTFGIFCEDDADEVHRRQDRINAAMGVGWPQLEDMRWACAVGGDDNVLVRFEQDRWRTTPRFDAVVQAAKDFGAQLIVLDTAVGGDDSEGQQFPKYLIEAMTKLARAIGGAVLLSVHPSRSGRSASCDMDGGSIAWSNTACSEWVLMRPRPEGGAEPDESLRILSRRKANHSARGEAIQLHLRNGVFVPAQGSDRAIVEATFLRVLDCCTALHAHVSSKKNAGNYAPRQFAKHAERGGCTQRDFERAMHQLLADGRIVDEQYGRPGDIRFRIVRVSDAAAAGVVEHQAKVTIASA